MIPSNCELEIYYVINFSEMRQKFDNGEDPLDPEAQQGHGGHPFHGHPFGGGGPFQFKFHFNWSRPHATKRANIFCIIKFLVNISEKKNY